MINYLIPDSKNKCLYLYYFYQNYGRKKLDKFLKTKHQPAHDRDDVEKMEGMLKWFNGFAN